MGGFSYGVYKNVYIWTTKQTKKTWALTHLGWEVTPIPMYKPRQVCSFESPLALQALKTACRVYPLVNVYIAIENGPVEIVDFPIKNGGSFHCYVSSPEGNWVVVKGFSWVNLGRNWLTFFGSDVDLHALIVMKQKHVGVSENSVPLNPMVLLIIIPFLNGYFIGNIPNIFRQTQVALDEWNLKIRGFGDLMIT